MEIPMPAGFHVNQMKRELEEVSDKLKRIYVEEEDEIMGGISMAVKFRHKETGLFFCRAKGLSPSRRDYDKLGEEGIFRKRHLSKRGRIYESATENQKRDWIGKKHADEFEIVKV